MARYLAKNAAADTVEVRVPLADGTVMKAPPEIDADKLVLMADIFPTGSVSYAE